MATGYPTRWNLISALGVYVAYFHGVALFEDVVNKSRLPRLFGIIYFMLLPGVQDEGFYCNEFSKASKSVDGFSCIGSIFSYVQKGGTSAN